MNKIKKEYLYLILGLLAGALIAVLVASNAVNSNNQDMMEMMGMRTMVQGTDQMMMGHSSSSMDQMVEALSELRGEEFDAEFINQMIEHHQGAIDMAELANSQASHQEIKDLARDIISAQTKEINLMRGWERMWGYR